jgi:hypothetical protein
MLPVIFSSADHYAKDIDVYVEAEETGNTVVKDIRRNDNGLAGVRWRSDYTGNVTIVVSITRATSRCGWCALVGRRNTVSTMDQVTGGGAPPNPNPGLDPASPASSAQ